MPKQIRLNAFDMNCVAHQSPGLWTHPRDRADRYNTLDYWVELARLLERGKFDALFLADVLGVYDVYGGSPDAALRNATQTPVNDPLLLISARITGGIVRAQERFDLAAQLIAFGADVVQEKTSPPAR